MFKVELTNNAGDSETSQGVSLNKVLKSVLEKFTDKNALGRTRCTIFENDEEVSWSWGNSVKEAIKAAQHKMKKFEDFRKDI